MLACATLPVEIFAKITKNLLNRLSSDSLGASLVPFFVLCIRTAFEQN